MIDLHSHTDASDGTYTPAELVEAAIGAGLDALAITDHDTFAGYDAAAPLAHAHELDLVCGIELSAKFERDGTERSNTVHLLGYWLAESPKPEFRAWLQFMEDARRDRNIRQIARLREMGADISLSDVEAYGRTMLGRPHFARALVDRGYSSSIQDAFDRYLGEESPGYVPKYSPSIDEAIQHVNDSGGISSLAHPVRLRLRDRAEEEALVAALAERGLKAIEAYHSDHSPEDIQRYLGYAEKYGLLVTGGSDFHGENKPNVRLARGKGGLEVPSRLLTELRASALGNLA